MPNHDRFECQTAIDSDAILQGRECNNEYTSKAKAALPDNDSLMMFLTISSFSLKDNFFICTSD